VNRVRLEKQEAESSTVYAK